MIKIFVLFFTLLIQQALLAFPGDHNSLTCDRNFINLQAVIYDTEAQYTADTAIPSPAIRKQPKSIEETDLFEYYRKSNTDPYKVQNRKNIIAAIQADLANPFSESIVKQNIRSRIISNDNGRTIHVTKWGDSLSDFVQVYGIMGPAYPSYETYKKQGIWGGGIGPIDSWDDYFSIFGNPSNQNVVFVQNYGIATYTTDMVLGLMGVSLENSIDVNWWDSRITDSHCIMEGRVDYFANLHPAHVFSGKSALRSSLMVAGNDLFHSLPRLVPLFPFLGSNTVDHIVDNITMITDWHIENGKKILLEGTIPGLAGKIKPYNSVVVSRKALCRPFDETFIPPQKIPWWLCAIGPSVCAQAKKATESYYKTIEQEFRRFGTNLLESNPEEADPLTLQSVYNNPIGSLATNIDVNGVADTLVSGIMDVANIPQSFPPDGGESKYNYPIMRIISINQACVNDRIEQDIGPSYKDNFPNNVDYLPLYNQFNVMGGNEFAPFFWVPKPGLYRKYMGKLTAGQKHDLGFIVPDPLHIGPGGYELWGSIEGTWLKQKEWNRIPIETDYPEPVVELDNDGPGKKIKRKALAIHWYGKETSLTKMIPKRAKDRVNGVGVLGGYYRNYKGGRIFLEQISDIAGDSTSKFGEPFSVSGLLLDRYLQEGGPAGKLGFPVTDPYLTWYNSIDRVDFQCGYIDHNQMNLLEPANTAIHITSTSCEGPQ